MRSVGQVRNNRNPNRSRRLLSTNTAERDDDPLPLTPIVDGLRAGLDGRKMQPDAVLSLQRAIGNRAVGHLLRAAPARSVIQRANNARPRHFAITNSRLNNARCEVETDTTWTSSGQMADLSDVQLREVVRFNANPTVDMPAYATLLAMDPRFTLNGTTMKKTSGSMQSGAATDKHSGAGYGPKFTINGQPNLRKAAWTLIGTQRYQYKRPERGNTWFRLHPAPFTITRQMALNGNTWELTITKTGNGVNVTAGPTEIKFETTQAMAAVAAARPDNTPDWTNMLNQLTGMGLVFHTVATDTRNVGGQQVTIRYDFSRPDNPPAANQQIFYQITPAQQNVLLANARAGVNTVIRQAIQGGPVPQRIVFTISTHGLQQAFLTNENGGTYRVHLRSEKLLNMAQWGAHLQTSISGREAQRGRRQSSKKARFTKGAATHELGHMMHAFESPNKFIVGTMMPNMIAGFAANDPLIAEKTHICNVNGQIIQALNAKGYKTKWTYARDNPDEVVAEVFTALLHGRNVPQGLAAVYLAYGGKRSQTIDRKLKRILGDPLPTLNQPEDAIPLI